ncbi:hypothetical protein YC2023_059883 [Brassica napus]
MSNQPLISHRLSHQTSCSGENPKQTLQVYIHRSNTEQSIIDFQLLSIIDNRDNFNDLITESMKYMLTYHDIHYLDSTFLIEETIQYVMNEVRDGINILASDLQVTLTIKDYNQNATSRLDVDLIITDLEGTNRTPTTEEENDICILFDEPDHQRMNLELQHERERSIHELDTSCLLSDHERLIVERELLLSNCELSWSRAEAEFVYDQERLGAGADWMKLRRERLQEQETRSG